MTTYVCVEVNTLATLRIKAKNFKAAVKNLQKRIPGATNPRRASRGSNKEVYIHYNQEGR